MSVSPGAAAEPGPGEALRAGLLDAGLLISTGVDGLYGRSGVFQSLLDAVDAHAMRAAAPQRPVTVRFPPVEPRKVFERSDYLASFPDLTGSIHTFTGGDREHAALLAKLGEGEDWTGTLVPADVVLCPAVCHPLYPTRSGALPEGGETFDVLGWVFRHEPSLDPARMQAFHQHDVVRLGTPDEAQEHRDGWVERALQLFSELGLDVRAEEANDPFFGRAGRILAANQRAEVLKMEIVAPVTDAAKPTAIFSANCHRDHFTATFGITLSDGGMAHTACVGFGLERIVLALLVRHGLDPQRWSAAVRTRLWL